MVKKLLFTLLGIALVFPVIALGQNSSLWKFTGYLEPVVSSWGLKIPSLTSCSLSTDGNGVIQCGGGSSGGGNVSATGSTNNVAYFTGPHTLSGSDVTWNDPLKMLSVAGSVGIGTANPLAKLHVGSGTINTSSDAMIIISRDLAGTSSDNGHAFADVSNFKRTTPGLSYNSYDVRGMTSGNTAMNHFAGFQNGMRITSTGLLSNIYGFVDIIVINGPVSERSGLDVFNPTGTGTLTTNRGIYVKNQTFGATNFAIQTDGGIVSFKTSSFRVGSGAVNISSNAVAQFGAASTTVNDIDSTDTASASFYGIFNSPSFQLTGSNESNHIGTYSKSNSLADGSARTVTNSIALYGANNAKGANTTITNSYGLYLENQTVGTNNFGLYSLSSNNYISGSLTVGTTVNKGAKINAVGTISGSTVHAQNSLTSSGTTALEQPLYIDSTKFGSGTRLATYVVDAGGGGDFTDIQSAIDALPSGGGKVFVKKGNYSLSTKLLIKQSNTTIEGEAFGVTIQCDGAVTRTCVGVNGINYFQISVKNLSITQTNATKQGNGLDMSDVALAFVDNVRISNFGTGAMLKDLNNNTFYSHYENLVLFDNINCLFIGGTESNMNYFENVRCRPSVGDSGTGIIIKDSRGLTFTNFDMEPTTAGTIAGFDIDATSRNITFINPWIEQNGLGGYIAAGAVRTTFIGGTFSSNTRDIVDLGTDTSFMNTNIFGVATTHFGAASMSGAVNMSSTLNIGGNLQMIDSDTRSEIILDNTNGNGDSLLNLRFPGAAQWLVGMDDDDNDNFKIDDGSSLDTSPRFMIDHAGSVGINTNIAKSKLTVFGSGAFTGSMSGANILVQSGGYIRGRLALGKTTAAEALDVNGNILSNSTIYIDSTGTSTFRSDRGATTNFASYILTTAGVDQWSMQTRNDSTNDFYLQDTLNGRTPLKIIQSSGLVKVKFGLSGSTLFSQDSLTSSGSFVYEGAGSGASLTVSNGFRGSGLSDCDTASSAVTWDITTSRFGCNTIIGTATYGAGQGLSLNGSNFFSLNASHSGSDIWALSSLRSSGSLVVEQGAVFNPSASSVNFDIYGAVNGPLFRVDSGNNDVLISGTTAANSDVIFSAGALGLDSIILNEQSRDADFRIESNDNTHAFYLDSGLNRIGIFNSSPLNALDVTGDVHASTGVFSSGSLIVEGTAKIHGTLSGNLIRATISPMVREVRFQSGTMLTGSGFAQFMIPAFASGWNLTAVQFDVRTAGTTNVTSVQLRQLDKNRVMLSTPISIDSGEKTSLTAATPYVINTANDDVHGGQLITVDVTGISSTPPKDPSILLQLTAP